MCCEKLQTRSDDDERWRHIFYLEKVNKHKVSQVFLRCWRVFFYLRQHELTPPSASWTPAYRRYLWSGKKSVKTANKPWDAQTDWNHTRLKAWRRSQKHVLLCSLQQKLRPRWSCVMVSQWAEVILILLRAHKLLMLHLHLRNNYSCSELLLAVNRLLLLSFRSRPQRRPRTLNTNDFLFEMWLCV